MLFFCFLTAFCNWVCFCAVSSISDRVVLFVFLFGFFVGFLGGVFFWGGDKMKDSTGILR